MLQLLIQLTCAQLLTNQNKYFPQQSYNIKQERLECNLNPNSQYVCNQCKAQHSYLLNDENWYVIGVYHNYGKEYKKVIEQLYEILGEQEIYIAFNQKSICLYSDANQIINATKLIERYTNFSYKFENLPLCIISQINQFVTNNKFSLKYNYENGEFYQKSINFSGQAQNDLLHEIIEINEDLKLTKNGNVSINNIQIPYIQQYYADKLKYREKLNLWIKQNQDIENILQIHLNKEIRREVKFWIDNNKRDNEEYQIIVEKIVSKTNQQYSLKIQKCNKKLIIL